MSNIDGVPLWIGGNEATHSAELLRMQNYVMFRGQEGFLGPSSVIPRATPGGGVQILPNAFVINSRFAGGGMQSYLDRIISAEDVPTTPTAVGSVRSDLIVLNCEDPYPSGGVQWPFPGAAGSDARRLGPYIKARVVENVPIATYTMQDLPVGRTERSWSAIAVARLDRPANSNTITTDQIKQLGVVINPFAGIVLPPEILNNIANLNNLVSDVGDSLQGILEGRLPIPDTFISHAYSVNGGSSGQILPANNTLFQFPTEAQWQVLVPAWATYAEIFCLMTGAYQKAVGTLPGNPAHIYGETVMQLGGVNGNPCPFDHDEIPGTDTSATRMGNRHTMANVTQIAIPLANRGKKNTLKQLGRMFVDAATKGKLVADAGTNTYISVKFKESA